MERGTALSVAPSAAPSSWGYDRRSSLLIVGTPVFGVLFLLSFLFADSFARAGITPASLLLCVLLTGVTATCGADALHPARILAVILAAGFVVGPIVHAATGIYALPDGFERQREELGRVTWMVLAGAALAMLAMRATLGDAWRRSLQLETRKPVSPRTLVWSIVVAAAGIALLVAYITLIGASSISLQGRGASYTVTPGEGRKAYLGLLAPIGLGGLLLTASWALERSSRVVLILSGVAAMGIGVLMALPGSRANLLYAIAPLFFLYVAYRGLPRWWWLFAAVATLVVALSYGGSLRSADARSALVRDPWRTLSDKGPTPESLERLFLVDVAHTEPLLGAIDAFPAARPFLGGESTAIGLTGPAGWKFTQLIGLQPDPPAGVTLTAAAYGRDPSTFGSGLTATLPGELYANAGVPGVLLGLAAFGAIAGCVRRYAVFSEASGALALYAAATTILFAVFADYVGQFSRGIAVLIGVLLALIVSRATTVGSLTRLAAIACMIAGASAGILIVRRFVGAPPTVMTHSAPVYLSLLGILVLFAIRRIRAFIGARHPRQ
jgi:hypothetical protein